MTANGLDDITPPRSNETPHLFKVNLEYFTDLEDYEIKGTNENSMKTSFLDDTYWSFIWNDLLVLVCISCMYVRVCVCCN